MILLAFICTAVTALIFGGFYVASRHFPVLLNFIFKFLSPLTMLILAIVSANLTSNFGGYPTFIILAFAFSLAYELFTGQNFEETKTGFIISNVFSAVSILCFTLAGSIFVNFNVWGLLLGLAIGIGTSCILLICKKQPILNWIITSIVVILAGVMFGQGLALFTSGANLVVTILFFFASLLSLFKTIWSLFADSKIMYIVSNLAQVLAWAFLASSIYFFI